MKLIAIDLFSGCGGLTEGMHQADFKTEVAFEIDEIASKAYKLNHPETNIITKDIRQVSIKEVKEKLKGKTIHLEDLIVKDKMRGKGLGYALYSEIVKQAKKDKVRRIDWNVLDWNTPAIEFYEKSGAKVLKEWRIAQMDEAAINNFVENKLKKIK